jgi:catechol 2,3-dioxygenase-like lactoylglutathione lyase family enzyme
MKYPGKPILATMIVMAVSVTSPPRAETEFSSSTIGIGVVVSNLEQSLNFYTNVIGMKKVGGFDINEEFGKGSGLTGGLSFHVEVLKLQDQPGATSLKLMSFRKEPGHPTPRNIQDDTGIQYITINVTSLKPFLERIKKHKIQLLGDTPVPLGSDRQFVLIQDPDGTFIELIGPMD